MDPYIPFNLGFDFMPICAIQKKYRYRIQTKPIPFKKICQPKNPITLGPEFTYFTAVLLLLSPVLLPSLIR
jgi:hypothetical protein